MLYVLAGLCLGADPRMPVKSAAYWLGWLLRSACWSAFVWLLVYTYQPAFVGPLYGGFVWLVLLAITLRFGIAAVLLGSAFQNSGRSRYRQARDGSLLRRHGFTFIELIVVMAIIVILMALLLPAIQQANGGSLGPAGTSFREFLILVALVVLDVWTLRRIEFSPAGAVGKSAFVACGSILGSLIVVWVTSWCVWQPAKYRDLLGDGKVSPLEWDKAIERPSEEHVRAISEEQALWKMKQALSGTVGTLYRPGKLFHQRNAEGRAYWIASLEYNNPGAVWFQRLMGADISPPTGYVRMSSENELESPLLVDKVGEEPIALRYTPEGWFGDNLQRLLYSQPGMKEYRLKKWAFELDDQGMPQYVVALCRPTIRFSGDRVEKYAIVNPQSGAIRYCEKDKLDTWVDDPMPDDIAQNNIKFWGLYPKSLGDGFWTHLRNNSGKDTVKAASDRQRLTWGADGKPYRFTGITSRSKNDTSLVCHLLINPRTGEAFEVEAKGQDETAVLTAIDNMLEYQHLHGTDPVMYTLYGHRAWVSPVSGESHLPMGIAIVDPDVRRPIYGTSKADAMLQWRQSLAQSTGDSKVSSTQELITIKGTIMVREIVSANGKSQVFLRLKEQPRKVFVVEAISGFEQAVVSVPGEKVELILLEFGDSRTSVESFRNLDMPVEVQAK